MLYFEHVYTVFAVEKTILPALLTPALTCHIPAITILNQLRIRMHVKSEQLILLSQ